MIEIKSAEYLRDRAAELERNLVYLRNMAIANIMDLEESEKCRLLAEEYIASVGGGKQYTEDEKRLIGVILRYQEHIDDNADIKTQYKLVISPIGDGILDGMYGTLDSCIEMWKYPTEEMQDFYFKGKEFAAVTKIALMVIAGMGDYGKNVEAAQNRPPVKPDVDYSNVRDMVSKGAGEDDGWYNADGSMNYPPGNGAIPGTERTVTLQPGQTVGRYGEIGAKSDFATAPGASSNSLALPPTTNPSIYTEIRILKPIPGVIQSTVAEWPISSGTGGGMQYQLPMPLETLRVLGYIDY